MAYNQKNQAGRGPKQKTGAGVPSALLQKAPVTDEKRGNDPDPLLTEYKKQFPKSNVSVIGGSNKSNKSTQNSNLQKKYKVENGNSSFTVYRSLGDKNKEKA